jgi:NAD(P)-dependent dehydrogenase (short-subunit alcohol dehydrogenase family)
MPRRAKTPTTKRVVRERNASSRPLAGRVAVVAGATRGAGRGIARGLAEAGAIVYCTGRSVRGNPSHYGRPETIDETAEMITAAGGTAIPVRVDHSIEAEVEALFNRVDREHGRLDVLADSVGGENPLLGQYGWFWTTDLKNGKAVFEQSLLSHIITAKHAGRLMVRDRRGLIVQVTENHILSAGGNPMAQSVKFALKGLALSMAAELKPHGVAAVSITPGYLRSERMLQQFGVTEATWRDHGKKDKNFLVSETPLYVGRAVAALAADPHVMKRTGQLFSSWDLAGEFKFTDADGRRPDWGTHDIDYSKHPDWLVELIRNGCEIQISWLDSISRRTSYFLKKMPKPARRAARKAKRS